MKKFSQMTYDKFTTVGEVNEGLPLHSKDLVALYKLDGDTSNYFPSFQLAINNNTITTIHGSSDMVKNISDVNVKDGCMEFLGDASSYLELDKSLLDSKFFEIEIKFKISDFLSTIRTLLMCKAIAPGRSENELSIIAHCNQRKLYSDMFNLKGIYTTKPDHDIIGAYSLADSGSINEDVWYTIKFCKYDGIVICYINDILTRSIICEGPMRFDKIYIGQESDGTNTEDQNFDVAQSFKGLIEYIKINKIEESKITTPRHIIKCDALKNDFTVSYDWYAKDSTSYDILNIGTFKNRTTGIGLVIGNSTLSLTNNNKYNITSTYNKATKSLNMHVYNKTTHKVMYDSGITIDMIDVDIDVVLNETVTNIAIYKTCLDKKYIIGNTNKRFSLNKDGDINYELDEISSHFKLDSNAKYHMQLTTNIDSDCGNISDAKKYFYADGGIKSGMCDQDDIMDLTRQYSSEATLVDLPWNKNLHQKAYRIPGWSTGYNAGVDNPQIGYHAKWTKEGNDSQDICLKMINCNKQFGYENRLLGIDRDITSNELWGKCKIGDKIKVTFSARSDIPSLIKVGIHRARISTGTNGFGDALLEFNIRDEQWNNYTYEYTIDPDLDLSKSSALYFYNYFTNNSTVWIKDIVLTRNSPYANSDILLDSNDRKIQIPFSKEIGLRYDNNWNITYKTKIISLDLNEHIDSLGNTKNSNGIYWGISENRLILNVKNKQTHIELPLDNLMNEWITISLSINSLKAELFVGTSKGVYKLKIDNVELTSEELYNSTYKYDLMLGGRDDLNLGCALYRELSIVKNSYITEESVENYFRNKFTYINNKIVSSVDFEESNLK